MNARQASRAERRKQQREQVKAMAKSREARLAFKRMAQNGITHEDLLAEHRYGWEEGRDKGIKDTVTILYACVFRAAHEEFGFGLERGRKLLKAVDRIFSDEQFIDDHEAVMDMYKRYGIKLVADKKDLDEPYWLEDLDL